MDAKEYLRSLKLLDTRIVQRSKQLKDIERRRSYINSLGGGDPDFEVIENIKAEILQCESRRNEIIGKIQSSDDHKFIQVLYKRYVEYKPFEQIAAELGYSRSYTLTLHRNALDALQGML